MCHKTCNNIMWNDNFTLKNARMTLTTGAKTRRFPSDRHKKIKYTNFFRKRECTSRQSINSRIWLLSFRCFLYYIFWIYFFFYFATLCCVNVSNDAFLARMSACTRACQMYHGRHCAYINIINALAFCIACETWSDGTTDIHKFHALQYYTEKS